MSFLVGAGSFVLYEDISSLKKCPNFDVLSGQVKKLASIPHEAFFNNEMPLNNHKQNTTPSDH